MTQAGSAIVMLGATGAVGGATLQSLLEDSSAHRISLLGRRSVAISDARVEQHRVDVHSPAAYPNLVAGHDCAICTLGVGQPSGMSREEFVRVDKLAVLHFARACKAANVRHFQLLSSVGSSPTSRSFFLRTKGELQQELEALAFDRLSLFEPSMILTDQNRYGLSQAVVLAVWPWLNPLLLGPLKSYRGIHVSQLGCAIAHNASLAGQGVERLRWSAISKLGTSGTRHT